MLSRSLWTDKLIRFHGKHTAYVGLCHVKQESTCQHDAYRTLNDGCVLERNKQFKKGAMRNSDWKIIGRDMHNVEAWLAIHKDFKKVRRNAL
jgi:hypothetical protein